jgi:hypothetical protein
MGAYISKETNEIRIVSCVCERREWEFYFKMIREELPKDIKLLKHKWIRMSYFDKIYLFRDAYSNHLTFKKFRVLSPLAKSVNFSASIMEKRKMEVRSLYLYF